MAASGSACLSGQVSRSGSRIWFDSVERVTTLSADEGQGALRANGAELPRSREGIRCTLLSGEAGQAFRRHPVVSALERLAAS
jgi:hypothetical protein